MIEDSFEDNADFITLKISVYSSRRVGTRRYDTISLPRDPEILNVMLIISLYRRKDFLSPSEIFYLGLPILKVVFFIFPEADFR